MAKDLTRAHTLILPLVLLVMVLLEALVTVELRARIANAPLRAALFMLLYGAGFTLAASVVTPWFKKRLVAARRTTKRVLGPWGFYVVAYGALYGAFYLWETSSSDTLPSELVMGLLGWG